MTSSTSDGNSYLLVPIVLMAVLLSTAVIRGPNLVSASGIGSAIIVAAPLILATYSLMILAVAGRGTIDLAVGPLLAFINVVVVKLSTAGLLASPIATFIVALGLGMIYQLFFALVIIFVRVQPIIVALSGFLALTGINLVIMPRPGGIAPEFMQTWGEGVQIFTPILAILVLATIFWYLFTTTSFYTNLKLMGYDERAAWTSGVKTDYLRVGAHLIAGIYVGLGAICYTALISSGDPTQGQNLTLTAVTAMVLGGIALSGGRGGATGALLGAISLWLIGYVLATFNFGAIQAFMTQMVYGLILVLSLILTLFVPVAGRYLRFISPWTTFLFLAMIVLGIMLQVATSADYRGIELARYEPLAYKYFLYTPVRLGDATWLSTPVQTFALLSGVSVVCFVFVAKLTSSERAVKKMGLFPYIFIALFILAAFVASLLGNLP